MCHRLQPRSAASSDSSSPSLRRRRLGTASPVAVRTAAFDAVVTTTVIDAARLATAQPAACLCDHL